MKRSGGYNRKADREKSDYFQLPLSASPKSPPELLSQEKKQVVLLFFKVEIF